MQSAADKRLAELTRVAQVALEVHRTFPDDDGTWHEFVKARDLHDTAWLEHVAALTP